MTAFNQSARTLAIVIAIILCMAIILGIVTHKGSAPPDQELIIFHAGSLSVPFTEINRRFMAAHPNVRIKAEAAGSRQCARKICDLGRPCDVIGSADYRVIENLMMPDHAEFNIRFATNEMAIAYTDRSRQAGQVSSKNWYRVLLDEDVIVGRSDPNADPCGYRTLMTFQLAEEYYRIEGLADRLEATMHEMRPKETDLLALLNAGEIDYLFIYRSVALQHGLQTLLLPEQVNLGSPAYADLYEKARVRIVGKTPGEYIIRHGEPVVYSVSIPPNAVNRAAAEAWVALLLSPEGQAVMEEKGQSFIQPPIVDGVDKLPASLLSLIATNGSR